MKYIIACIIEFVGIMFLIIAIILCYFKNVFTGIADKLNEKANKICKNNF
jgi:hypothetical protein